ncbi:MAG: serine/threonine protein kinase [Pseudonocardia sp.]|nr:serine/threonine protein kinase [Pseudonocardia sp.]
MADSTARYYGERYRVGGVLGRGGMSQVFHGYDERLDRRVAIKVLRQPQSVPSTPDSPEAAEILDGLERDRKRFLREIRTTARLELAGAPAVYDTGVEATSDGAPQLWVVMQLLRGTTLEAVLDGADYENAPPSIAWASAIGAQIAAVLADVHRVDVVHRDIKPANVMIVDGGLVKVLDFGIAILRGAGALPRLTQVDRTIGTPPYMSPEQNLGLVVTAASDVYSLGCLLTELLTGDPPFHGTSAKPLRVHHLQSSAPSVRARRADVPAELDALVTQMLAKGPDDRPSADAVYAGLVAFTAGGGAETDAGREPVSDPDRDPTRPFRRPLLSPRRHPADGHPTTPLAEAEYDELVANVEALLDADRPDMAVRLLDGGVERSVGQPYQHLRLRHHLAVALAQAGEFTRAAPLFVAVAEEYRRYRSTPESMLRDLAYQAGLAYAELGRAHQALPQLRYFVMNAGGADAEQVVGARFLIAQMLGAAGERDRAADELEAVRPGLLDDVGGDSAQVRNLDRLLSRLREG